MFTLNTCITTAHARCGASMREGVVARMGGIRGPVKNFRMSAEDGLELVEAVDDCPFERREKRYLEQKAQKRRALEKHPAVAEVVKRFNGTVRQVQAYDPREQHA